MKKTLIILTLFIAWLSSQAQSLTAEQVLSRCYAKMQEAPAIEVAFRATAADKSVDGSMTISQEKFAMATSDYSVWYDGADMWCYYKSNGETYLSYPTLDELMEINPFVILNGYKNTYNAKVVSAQDGKYTLQMIPLNHSSQIKQATITINSSTWLPTSVTATFVNNAQVKVSILSASIAKAVPPLSTFCYPAKDYPTVEIIDLR